MHQAGSRLFYGLSTYATDFDVRYVLESCRLLASLSVMNDIPAPVSIRKGSLGSGYQNLTCLVLSVHNGLSEGYRSIGYYHTGC